MPESLCESKVKRKKRKKLEATTDGLLESWMDRCLILQVDAGGYVMVVVQLIVRKAFDRRDVTATGDKWWSRLNKEMEGTHWIKRLTEHERVASFLVPNLSIVCLAGRPMVQCCWL